MPPSQINKILIIKLGAFGDVLVSDGAVQDIRAAHPNAEITLLTGRPYKKLYKRHPAIDRVWEDPRPNAWNLLKLYRIKQMLLSEPFDRIYDLQNNARTNQYFKWMRHLGAEWSGKSRGAAFQAAPTASEPICYLDRLAAQLEVAGLTCHHTPAPDVRWLAGPAEQKSIADCLKTCGLSKVPFVVLVPGSSKRHPDKRWPHYGDLALALDDLGWPCVTAPGPEELDVCKALPAPMLMMKTDSGDERPLNFFELAALFQNAQFCIGNDTGPTHLAVWSHLPGLALFGPHTSAKRTGIGRIWPVIETTDLANLSVQTVLEQTASILKSLETRPQSVRL